MTDTQIQNWLIAITLVVTTIVTVIIQIQANMNEKKNRLNQQLFELQKLSFEYPHVENEDYTNQWVDLKEKYKNGLLKENGLSDFLKYDVYTEILYNFIQMSLNVYKNEKELLKFVDFKSWVRTHGQNWANPLIEHSNRDVYGNKMSDMIDKWLK